MFASPVCSGCESDPQSISRPSIGRAIRKWRSLVACVPSKDSPLQRCDARSSSFHFSDDYGEGIRKSVASLLTALAWQGDAVQVQAGYLHGDQSHDRRVSQRPSDARRVLGDDRPLERIVLADSPTIDDSSTMCRRRNKKPPGSYFPGGLRCGRPVLNRSLTARSLREPASCSSQPRRLAGMSGSQTASPGC